MTILPPHIQRDARNLATASLSMLAFRFQCEVTDILALLNQQPSAPSRPKAAAASTPPVGAQAEEVAAPVSSADQSQAKAADDATSGSAMSEPLAPASGPLEAEAASRGDGARSPSATSEDMDATAGETAPVPVTGKSAGASAPAAPAKRITQRQRVRECHEAHPDWMAQQVADDLGLTKTNVQSIASQIGIKWDDKKVSTTEALKQAVKAAPHVPALPIAKSLKDRVRETLAAHPTWTAAQIANHIGHSVTSVSTTLANVRREAAAPAPEAPPQFSGRREMVEHYGAIAKRLGKPS